MPTPLPRRPSQFKRRFPSQAKRRSRQSGFTLVELLIVVTMTVVLLLTVTTLFMTTLITNGRNNMRKTLKAEGNQALSQMEFMVRNSRTFGDEASDCTDSGTPSNEIKFTFQEPTNQVTLVAPSSPSSPARIEYYSSTRGAAPVFLTSERVVVSPAGAAGEVPYFVCTTKGGSKTVEINFRLTISDTEGSISRGTPLSEDFRSLVTLRNN